MSVYKEFLLLKRDIGGVMTLFLMPLVLIITVTLIQDSSYKKGNDVKIPILLVDYDKGNVSKTIFDNLRKSTIFSVVTTIDNVPITEAVAKEAVFKGKYQLALIIPSHLSVDLQSNIDQKVQKIISSLGFADSLATKSNIKSVNSKEVRLYFDPATKFSFKNSVMEGIDKMVSQIETKSIYAAFQDQLGEGGSELEQKSFIVFKEIVPKIDNKDITPNSVQQNVPAWTLFAIFFIVIPLSINMVKEKTQGTFIRLRTNPVSDFIVLAGKTVMYLIICQIQFYMMIAVAVFLFPHLGLPALNVEGNLVLMSIVALFSSLAAIGFGILLGTVAKTQEQSAPFGATAVIILASIGGVWIPVFAMPRIMQIIAQSSPMNWGLEAFYDVLLRHASFLDLVPKLFLLFLFFVVTTTLALLYDKKKRAV